MKLKQIIKEIITIDNKNKVISYLRNTQEPILFQTYDQNEMIITFKLADTKTIKIILQNPLSIEQRKLLTADSKRFVNNLNPMDIYNINVTSFR